MFVDYYKVLCVDKKASLNEIKKARKTLALKFHPDKNPNKDTTKIMQLINEAYLILKDAEARERYDIEYEIFNQRKKEKKTESTKTTEKERYYEYTYDVEDDILKKWMSNAKKQAVDLAKQSIEDIIGMTSIGAKEATKGCFSQLLVQIVLGIIFIFLLKMCNS